VYDHIFPTLEICDFMYKKKKKFIFLTLIILLFLLFTNSILDNRLDDLKDASSKETKNIDKDNYIKRFRTSGYWILSSISIDDSLTGVGAHNWTWAANQPWCSGSGGVNDPYIIENVTINAQSATNGIEIKSSTKYFIIRNVTVYNSSYGVNNAGIYLNNANNGRLINNTLANNNGNGIYIINSIDNVLLENRGYNNSWYGIILIGGHYSNITKNRLFNNTKGIYVMNSLFNNLSSNRVFNNSEEGINLLNSKHNVVNENIVYNNTGQGLCLYSQSTYNIISKNIVNNNSWDGIYVEDSANNTLIGNNATNNSGDGIFIASGSNNNTVKENTLNINNQGINLYSNVNNIITGNTINNSTYGGIRLVNCNFTKVLENTVNHCGEHGIYVENSNNTSITKNNVYNNLGSGIYLFQSKFGTISKNRATFNGKVGGHDGILIRESMNNTISQNTVQFNYDDGIGLNFNCTNNSLLDNVVTDNGWAGIILFGDCDENHLFNNIITDNSWYGIYLSDSSDNDVIGNKIRDNIIYGVNILNLGCENNLFSYNFFIGNGRHAYDDGWYNFWNSSTIGNYWDNYSGIDANNDGIGDTPYCLHPEWLPGWVINDSFPIYDVSAPVVDINSPNTNELFGSSAPIFNIAITDHYLDSMWYVINGGSNNLIFSTSGPIDQGLWNGFGSGFVTITFYANDSLNQIGFTSVTIRKDITSPVININDPNPNDIFGSSAPDFNINVIEPNLGTMWYTLNGGANIFITTSSGTINQTAWDAFPEGSITIRFYAEDLVGNRDNAAVIVTKELPQPVGEIPGYSLFTLIGVMIIFIAIISFVIDKKCNSPKN